MDLNPCLGKEIYIEIRQLIKSLYFRLFFEQKQEGKTSGTVAMVTAATMLSPMLDALGFAGLMGSLVAMIACAAGGFMVFHGNDDFFWVITSASEMEPSIAYKTLPIASIAQSFTALALAYVLKLVLL